MRDKFFKVMLIVVTILLFLNLFQHAYLFFNPKAFASGSFINHIACSSNGQIVYVVRDNNKLLRSDSYGKGQWAEVGFYPY